MYIKLGIIIPTYNSLNTLKVLVKNILDYTQEDFIIYVVEDGQRKETIGWLKTQNIKKILHKKNKGVAISWNDGIKRAKKDGCTHFAIFNDDIELPEGWWEECRDLFYKNANLVTLPHSVANIVISGWFFIIDRKCIERVGYFDEQFSPCFFEDLDYKYRCSINGIRTGIVNIDVYHHGGTTTYGELKESSNKSFNNNYHKFIKKHPKVRMQAQKI